MAELVKTSWHNFPVVGLENDLMRVLIVPELGAKIVSLLDKAHDFEWLVPPMRPLQKAGYGADFVSQDMSGWDEMMPTIVACTNAGAAFPDHGEIWSIPWKVQEAASEVVLSVAGRALPYQFTRSATLVTPDCLELRYTVKNTGTTAFHYLWAAHPQFNADADTRIVLPPEVKQMVNVMDGDSTWGASGALYDWPEAKPRDGRVWRLDQVRAAQNQACRKFYLPPEQSVSWAALVHPGLRCQIHLSWSPDDSPYLGLWVDEGRYNSLPVAALEPSNAYYDSLEQAVRNGRAPLLEPGIDQTWKLQVKLSALSEGPVII